MIQLRQVHSRIHIVKCRSSIVLWSLLLAFTISSHLYGQDLDVPYVPTPHYVVEEMLDLANVKAGDYVIDLGSGDGRIVIHAVRRGAFGHGIELDPERVREARENAKNYGVEDRVIFLEQDIFDTDFSQASVITMYLLPSLNVKLRPQLLSILRPGTRVISHSFDMDDWTPDASMVVTPDSVGGGYHPIYLWIIPANVEGQWEWVVNRRVYSIDISQKFQKISVNLFNGNNRLDTKFPYLRGDRISLMAKMGGRNFIYSGHIQQDTIHGTVQIRRGSNQEVRPWTAVRK